MIDSVKSFYLTGQTRHESSFVKANPTASCASTILPENSGKRSTTKIKKPNGLTTTFYEDGTLQTEANFKDGVINGFFKTYYANGQLETISTMKEGEKTGQFKNYDREGHLLLEGYFTNGRLTGENLAYFTDGTVRHRFHYIDGGKTGTNIEYHRNGSIKTREVVSFNGVDMKEEGFREDGTQAYEKNYRKLKPQGVWTYYFDDGRSVSIKENYDNGKLHGKRTLFYQDGGKKLEEIYQFNLITGTVTNYFPSGKPSMIEEYRASRPHGQHTAYYESGKVKEQGEFVAGKKHKTWTEFDEQGMWSGPLFSRLVFYWKRRNNLLD